MVIIPPYVSHSNESEHGFTNIHLNLLEPSLNMRQPILLKDDGNHFIRDAFQAAFYYFSSDSPMQTLVLASYADLIVNLLLSNQGAPKHSPAVSEIESNIITNYPDENYELDTYLRSLPFNYDYVRKLFKRELGVTPHQYLADIRLETAAKNLRISEIQGSNISEISHMCGFSDPLYFSRLFKKKFGVSPSQYHELLEKESSGLTADTVKILL